MHYLDPERVRSDRVVDEMHFVQGRFLQMDLAAAATGVHLGEHWWSSFSQWGRGSEQGNAEKAG